MESLRIGLALSGGGVRALGFHVGVLARLADENLLENITFISSVSGGSLGVALILALNGWKWPSSSEFKEIVLPALRKKLTKENLQTRLITSTLFSRKNLFRRRASNLAKLLERHWNINESLCDIPDQPRWVINATCHETGKRWRFEKKRIGEQSIGEIPFPDFPVSQAIAASAAIPLLIGPLEFDASKFNWRDFDNAPNKPLQSFTLHLWDGALYDNLGLEGLVKVGGPSRFDEFNFLIVSDGSPPLPYQPYNRFRVQRWLRIMEILGSQSQSLRSRDVVSKLNEGEIRGGYLKLGSSIHTLCEKAGKTLVLPTDFVSLNDHQIEILRKMDLSLKKLSNKEFDYLLCNGYETASTVLHIHNEDHFPDFVPHSLL